jgi:transcriptional regulator with XRE-family HTH domain
VAREDSIDRVVDGLGGHLGGRIREDRRRARWTIRRLATEAGVSPSLVQWVEAGHVASLETYVRLGRALGRRFEVDLVDPRRTRGRRDEDPVHAAMGEVLATRLRAHNVPLSLDEPYQHYQFAGRADLVAWDLGRASLLHVENRTRLPNFQEAAGAYNAKRRWLAPALADRLGIREFRSVSHVLVALWSAEMLHVVRLRAPSLSAICPDGTDSFERWLAGDPPTAGVTSAVVLFDPIAKGRSDRRQFVDLETALRPATRPRYRGYADAADELRRAGLA